MSRVFWKFHCDMCGRDYETRIAWIAKLRIKYHYRMCDESKKINA